MARSSEDCATRTDSACADLQVIWIPNPRGKATDSEKLEAEGLAQQAKGKAEKLAGDAKQAVKDAANKVADAANKKL